MADNAADLCFPGNRRVVNAVLDGQSAGVGGIQVRTAGDAAHVIVADNGAGNLDVLDGVRTVKPARHGTAVRAVVLKLHIDELHVLDRGAEDIAEQTVRSELTAIGETLDHGAVTIEGAHKLLRARTDGRPLLVGQIELGAVGDLEVLALVGEAGAVDRLAEQLEIVDRRDDVGVIGGAGTLIEHVRRAVHGNGAGELLLGVGAGVFTRNRKTVDADLTVRSACARDARSAVAA